MVSSPSSLGEVMFLRNGGVLHQGDCVLYFGEWKFTEKCEGFRGVDAIDMHLKK